MRLHEINVAASALLARELPSHSMKQALSANLKGRRPRFRRLSLGLYDLDDNSVARNGTGLNHLSRSTRFGQPPP
jgi:hypothetical protein